MKSYSLKELQQFIQQVLALNFEQAVWINVEIGQASQSRGHFYLQLIQKDEAGEDLIAEARANIWSSQARKIQEKLGTQLPLKDLLEAGNAIKMLVEVSYHARFGLSLNVLDISQEHSLGLLAKQRQETLNKLIAEKLLDKNKQLELPKIPQHIAVLSSSTAAGFADFKDQLQNNPYGYAFQMDFYQVAVQGKNVREDILHALKAIMSSLYRPDLIIILRGGGSKLDLMAFDDYLLCEAIAHTDCPVLVAVGHETDESVLDLVAHTSVKTPTAAADFLIERLAEFESELIQLETAIQLACINQLKNRSLELQHIDAQLKSLTLLNIQQKTAELDRISLHLKSHYKSIIDKRFFELERIEAELSLLNPVFLLEKGYSFASTAEGKIIKSVEETQERQNLIYHFKDGKLYSTITKIQKND